MASGPGSNMHNDSARRKLCSSNHGRRSTNSWCINEICAAGPPNERRPMRPNTRTSSDSEGFTTGDPPCMRRFRRSSGGSIRYSEHRCRSDHQRSLEIAQPWHVPLWIWRHANPGCRRAGRSHADPVCSCYSGSARAVKNRFRPSPAVALSCKRARYPAGTGRAVRTGKRSRTGCRLRPSCHL